MILAIEILVLLANHVFVPLVSPAWCGLKIMDDLVHLVLDLIESWGTLAGSIVLLLISDNSILVINNLVA